jgi:hypothetical protein
VRAFIVVYQHAIRTENEILHTRKNNIGNHLVEKYLEEYLKSDSYLDWADDPSFFCAREMLGDIRKASWGVCRRDVRKQLRSGDIVVFFCGKQNLKIPKEWKYYFVGFGTVKETLSRDEIWKEDKYSLYRDFYNILSRPEKEHMKQCEIIGKGHPDWKNRLTASYIIFDSNPQLTNFNIINPLEVAIKRPDMVIEEWLDTPKVKDLKNILLLQFGCNRNLRINNIQRAHRHIALHNSNSKEKAELLIKNLASQLNKFVN